jgi:AraC-like DNA-binding protein
VHFAHARPKELAFYKKLLGPHVEFGSDFNGITCLASDLDRPNLAADPTMALYAARLVDSLPVSGSTSIADEVRKSIYTLLPLGRASIGHVARALGLHERTLQRRLAKEGVEFSEILNDVRCELAKRYMANPANSLTHIADLLGYAQLSSFSRWFTSEFGVPPIEWKRQ